MTATPQNELDNHILLEQLIKQIKNLPTLSNVAQEILRDLDEDSTGMDEICEKVSMDQSLAAKTLKLANSSYYGTDSKVVTLQQAVALLGIKNVKNLILMTSIAGSFQTSKCQNFDFKAFWRHSIATAICAEIISRTLRLKHDFAFTAGLLHDIGKLALVTVFPKEYESVIAWRDQEDCYLMDAERAVLGIDHVEAGLVLAKHWQFSIPIQDAIRGHHQPTDEGLNSVATIVHVADVIVHGLDLSKMENDRTPLLSVEAWDTLALNETDCLAIFRETELRFEAVEQMAH
jgi:putative nucleotidyltransferase with HDIG domain